MWISTVSSKLEIMDFDVSFPPTSNYMQERLMVATNQLDLLKSSCDCLISVYFLTIGVPPSGWNSSIYIIWVGKVRNELIFWPAAVWGWNQMCTDSMGKYICEAHACDPKSDFVRHWVWGGIILFWITGKRDIPMVKSIPAFLLWPWSWQPCLSHFALLT